MKKPYMQPDWKIYHFLSVESMSVSADESTGTDNDFNAGEEWGDF